MTVAESASCFSSSTKFCNGHANLCIASDVNFTNIFRVAFLCKSALRNFSLLTVWVAIFWQKEISSKAAHKLLVKLTIIGRNSVFAKKTDEGPF